MNTDYATRFGNLQKRRDPLGIEQKDGDGDGRVYDGTPRERAINSRSFKEWFGNSQIVDGDGKPLVVYHGTNREFSEFDTKRIGENTGNGGHQGDGLYFSFDPVEAEGYGDSIMPVYLSIQKPWVPTLEGFEELVENGVDWMDPKTEIGIEYESLHDAIQGIDPVAAELMAVVREKGYEKGWEDFYDSHPNIFQSHSGPVDLNDVGTLLEHVDKKVEHDYNPHLPYYLKEMLDGLGVGDKIKYQMGWEHRPEMQWVTDLGNRSREVTDIIKGLGYDGIIVGSEIVVFDPLQVKSASANVGTFGKSDPDIRKLFKPPRDGDGDGKIHDGTPREQSVAAADEWTDEDEEKLGRYTAAREAMIEAIDIKMRLGIGKAIALRQGIDSSHRDIYRKAMLNALQRFPIGMLKRLNKNVKEIVVFGDSDRLARHLYGNDVGRRVGGAWGRNPDGVDGKLFLDGGYGTKTKKYRYC